MNQLYFALPDLKSTTVVKPVYISQLYRNSACPSSLCWFFFYLQVRNWEEKLQMAAGEDSVDELCALAEDQLKVHRQNLPKPGA